eukprot:g6437.t1
MIPHPPRRKASPVCVVPRKAPVGPLLSAAPSSKTGGLERSPADPADRPFVVDMDTSGPGRQKPHPPSPVLPNHDYESDPPYTPALLAHRQIPSEKLPAPSTEQSDSTEHIHHYGPPISNSEDHVQLFLSQWGGEAAKAKKRGSQSAEACKASALANGNETETTESFSKDAVKETLDRAISVFALSGLDKALLHSMPVLVLCLAKWCRVFSFSQPLASGKASGDIAFTTVFESDDSAELKLRSPAVSQLLELLAKEEKQLRDFICIPDLRTDPRTSGIESIFGFQATRTLMAPINDTDGRLVGGLICFDHISQEPAGPPSTGLVQTSREDSATIDQAEEAKPAKPATITEAMEKAVEPAPQGSEATTRGHQEATELSTGATRGHGHDEATGPARSEAMADGTAFFSLPRLSSGSSSESTSVVSSPSSDSELTFGSSPRLLHMDTTTTSQPAAFVPTGEQNQDTTTTSQPAFVPTVEQHQELHMDTTTSQPAAFVPTGEQQHQGAESLLLKLMAQYVGLQWQEHSEESKLERVREESDRLQDQCTELKEAEHNKTAFLRTMSHELRTPVNAIMGFSDLLAETSVSAEQSEYLEYIASSARVVTLVVNDVLDLARMDAHLMAQAAQPFELQSLVDNALKYICCTVRPQHEDALVDVFVDVEPSVKSLFLGDPGGVHAVLLRLLQWLAQAAKILAVYAVFFCS